VAAGGPQSEGAAHPVFDPRKIIKTLNRHRVDYAVIGGFAA
jgi:hypothetical protein